jgi:3-isopropylmalate/(R)-2-methylmalate dehydratase large subunit
MGMTMAEKILARHSGQTEVRPGDLVNVTVDWAVDLDMSYSTQGGINKPLKLFNPERVVVVADHLVPAPSVEVANGLNVMRQYVKEMGIKWLFDVGNQGISHQIVAENGFALPGQILTCGDSHTVAAGAFNCAARGMGSEMLYILAKGQTWFICGPSVRFILTGRLPERVQPRDILHHIADVYGDFVDTNLEFVGEGAATIPVPGRQTVSTMCAEISAEFALWEADDILLAYLDGRAKEPFEPAFADPDARYEAVHEVDLSELEPKVALPGAVPGNVKPARALHDVKLTQCFIGSCANGRLEDFAVAAEILKGRRVHPEVRLLVTPSSQAQLLEATKRGYVTTLLEAGAVVTASTCGACFGGHMGVLGDEDVCITASTRNFTGRMGSPQANIYLGSPATVAASAIKGRITDPRDV